MGAAQKASDIAKGEAFAVTRPSSTAGATSTRQRPCSVSATRAPTDGARRGRSCTGARQAYEAVTDREMPDQGLICEEEPLREPWDEATVGDKYPELAAKFGFR